MYFFCNIRLPLWAAPFCIDWLVECNLHVEVFPVIHTYIIGHYNPSVRIIDRVSHTTYVVCVNFIHKWRQLQFKGDSERQIFRETFHGNFYLLPSEFLPEICWEEISEEILFVLRFSVWPGTRTTETCQHLLKSVYAKQHVLPTIACFLRRWNLCSFL